MFYATCAIAADNSEVSKEIATTDMKSVKDAIMQVVMSTPKLKGIKLHHTDDYSIVFQKIIDNPMAILLYSNSYAMRYPVNRLYFNLVPFSDKILVQSYIALVKNPDSGAEHELAPSTNKNDLQGLAQILEEIKAVVEPGYVPLVIEKQQTSDKKEKQPIKQQLGIKFEENGTITEVQENSCAYQVLFVGDKILEINASPINSMTKEEAEKLLAEKWEAGLSIMFTYERGGVKDIVSIKRAVNAEK